MFKPNFEPEKWQTGIPPKSTNMYGLPKLYLCQTLNLDSAFGYRYSYQVGFVNEDNKWNLEDNSMCYVTRYTQIICKETMEQLVEDIKKVQEKEKDLNNNV